MNPRKLADETTRAVRARRYARGESEAVEDALTVEAPLQITVNGVAFTTTMRTPGEDRALARGLLYTEGIVSDADVDFETREVPDPESGHCACVEVRVPADAIRGEIEGRRSLLSSSSCGVCGTRDAADIEVYGPPLTIEGADGFEVSRIPGMLEAMRGAQDTFDATGGSHAAALFDSDGEVLVVREDIGRHNAVDKSVGSLLEEGRLAVATVLLVSGRLSYEIVYKAYRAEIPVVISVSAVSSMAVDTAERLGMTLYGFCRGDSATAYTGNL